MRYKNLFGKKEEEPILKTRSPKNKEERKEYQKKWRLENQEKIKEQRKKYYLENQEKIKEQAKKYQLENQEKVSERQKKYRLKNPEKLKEQERKWRLENQEKIKEQHKKYWNIPENKYRIYKESAETRGHKWELTFEEFAGLILKPCGYCGEKKEARGVDRIDNKKGYVPGNVTACCARCNFSKGRVSENVFLKWLKKAALFQEKKKEI